MPTKPLPPEDLSHVLAHTQALWAEARGRSFFITGGTGFFGIWLLESFTHINDSLGLGMRATVLTRDPIAFKKRAPHLTSRPDLALLQGDILTFTPPQDEYHYIIHAAAEVSSDGGACAAESTLITLIEGTRRILDLARTCGTQKLLLTSSGATYGPQPEEISHIAEDHLGAPNPLHPSAAYGEGKRASELLAAARSLTDGYEVKIARCFAFVGPHLPLDKHFAVGNFLRDVLAQAPIKIGGDGTPRRSYLYSADLAIWLWTILFLGQNRRCYNVGSSNDLSISEIAQTVNRALNGHSDVRVSISPTPDAPISRYVPCIKRAQQELGLNVHIGLEEALSRTAKWINS